MLKKFISFSNLTLLVALSLSTVAAYYSIIGLTAIFAGAVIPVIIMGSILEVGKITTTVWLRKYWHRASWVLKMYLVPAVVALAVLTSMGIFGFLSKAHMDQGLTSGDVQAKLSLYDEKIKTQRDNIEVARKALQQMDAQVDARLGRSDSEQGAERAVQIRRQQAGERAKLQKEIGDAQKEIAKLNEERAPIAAENRKVEAEVGPIKYIASLIYGDSADTNTLEAAVRWVIILLVAVFDPLAIALVLAANASKEWDKEEPEPTEPKYEADDGPLTQEQIEQIIETVETLPVEEPITAIIEPVVEKKVKKTRKKTKKVAEAKLVKDPEPVVEQIEAESISPERPGDYVELEVPTIVSTGDGYITYNGKHMSEQVFKQMEPALYKEATKKIINGFGNSFPAIATVGDMFVRTDMIPNGVYKFNGRKWIQINKETTSSYLDNKEYLQFLVDKISSGEYDVEILTDEEQEAVRTFMSKV